MNAYPRANRIVLMALLMVSFLTLSVAPLQAGDNLRLNQQLDYSSDSQDGPLITGGHMDEGAVGGQPNYIIFYGEGCFNSKRQARRTVSLYEKYRGRVHFVIVDLDLRHSAAQQDLVKKYYQGAIPHVTILDKNGKVIYDRAGEEDESKLATMLDGALN